MKQTPNQEQTKEQQLERRRKNINIGTSLEEMYEEMRKRKKSRFIEGCNDRERDDDDADCFCD